MEQRKAGGIQVSKIGMGCMGFSHGYGDIPSEEYSVNAIRKAYEAGCTFFDTAEGYGALLYGAGHNERLLGKAVAPFRDKVTLATKFHFSGEAPQTQAEVDACIRRHLEQSLRNLQTDHVELYYLHRVSKLVSIEMVGKSMESLAKEGLIKGWGLSQVGPKTLQKANECFHVSAVQNLYNMMERDAEDEVIPYCKEHDILFVPFSPVGSGFLSGKVNQATDFSHVDDVRKYVPQLSKENIEANAAILALLEDYAQRKNATKAQISLAWMVNKHANLAPIPGSKNLERILENLGAAKIILSEEEVAKIDMKLNALPIRGHRGQEEFEGGSMADWGKKR